VGRGVRHDRRPGRRRAAHEARAELEADPDVEALALYGTALTSVGADGFDVTGLVAVLEGDPDVEALALYGTALTSVRAEGFDVTGLIAVRGSTATELFDGRPPRALDEIAIGRVAARRFGVGVGDTLVVASATGEHPMRVTGVGAMPPGEGGDGVGEGGVVTFDALAALDPGAEATGAQLRVRPGASPAAVAERLSERTGMDLSWPLEKPAVIINVARVRAVPYVIAVILGVLVLVNLAHQLIVSGQRRRRDLAVLRSLGADGRWASGVVHHQASAFTVAVALGGLPVGIVAGRVVYRAFVGRIGALDAVTLPVGVLVATLIGLLVLANVVAAPRGRAVRRGVSARALAQE
jgi:ABC-type lipoprotein release transport system permease subunit